jgi:hypothetical protein
MYLNNKEKLFNKKKLVFNKLKNKGQIKKIGNKQQQSF